MEATVALQTVSISPTGELRRQVRVRRLEGKQVIDLSRGELPDPTPHHVIAAAHEALQVPASHHYGDPMGDRTLRALVAETESMRQNASWSADCVVIANGAKQALSAVLHAILKPGDEVLIPAPYWVTFPEAVRLAGGCPTIVPPEPPALFPTAEALKSAVGAATKAIILNSPGNPSGELVPESILEALLSLACERNLWIVADETYARVAMDKGVSPLVLEPNVRERFIVINSTSKSHAMSGWRVGWCCCPEEVARAVGAVQSHTISCVPSFVQAAAVAALSDPSISELFRSRLLRQRAEAVVELRTAGFEVGESSGAFYLFPLIDKLGAEDHSVCSTLIETEGVALLPGSVFGVPGRCRISYAGEVSELREGIRRFTQFANRRQERQAS